MLRSFITALSVLSALSFSSPADAQTPAPEASSASEATESAAELAPASPWTFGPSFAIGRFTFGENRYKIDSIGASFYVGRQLTDQLNLNINLSGATQPSHLSYLGLGTAVGLGWGPNPEWANLVSMSLGVDLYRETDDGGTGLLTGDLEARNVFMLLNFGMNVGE